MKIEIIESYYGKEVMATVDGTVYIGKNGAIKVFLGWKESAKLKKQLEQQLKV